MELPGGPPEDRGPPFRTQHARSLVLHAWLHQKCVISNIFQEYMKQTPLKRHFIRYKHFSHKEPSSRAIVHKIDKCVQKVLPLAAVDPFLPAVSVQPRRKKKSARSLFGLL